MMRVPHLDADKCCQDLSRVSFDLEYAIKVYIVLDLISRLH